MSKRLDAQRCRRSADASRTSACGSSAPATSPRCRKLSSPALAMVKSPISLPASFSIGVSTRRPVFGMRLVISRRQERLRARPGDLVLGEVGDLGDADALARRRAPRAHMRRNRWSGGRRRRPSARSPFGANHSGVSRPQVSPITAFLRDHRCRRAAWSAAGARRAAPRWGSGSRSGANSSRAPWRWCSARRPVAEARDVHRPRRRSPDRRSTIHCDERQADAAALAETRPSPRRRTRSSCRPCTGPTSGLPSGAKVNGPLMICLMPAFSSAGKCWKPISSDGAMRSRSGASSSWPKFHGVAPATTARRPSRRCRAACRRAPGACRSRPEVDACGISWPRSLLKATTSGSRRSAGTCAPSPAPAVRGRPCGRPRAPTARRS